MEENLYIDPLHGTTRFDEWEDKLLKLPELQRLRYIKQTGLAYLVYPGLRHTVWDHVLGTLCLVKKYLHHLQINEKEKKILLASILLRDVGSEPIRHVLWDVETYIPEKQKRKPYGSDDIVQESQDINDALKSINLKIEEICKIIKLNLKGESYEDWLRKLRPFIHGPLSFNRLDYYLRDAYYSGIKSIGFDPGEILKNIIFDKEKGVIYGEEAVPSIENVLLSRVNLYFKLYSNPDVVKWQKMLARAIQITISERYDEFYKLRAHAVKNFLSDEEFIHQLKEKARINNIATHIIELIESGQSYKSLDGIYRWTELSKETQKKLDELQGDPAKWINAEREVNENLDVNYGQVIVDFDKPTVKSEIEKIFIKGKRDGSIERIDKISPLIGSIDQKNGKGYGIIMAEKRNWFFGVYYDEAIKKSGIGENQIKKEVEGVYGISLPKRRYNRIGLG